MTMYRYIGKLKTQISKRKVLSLETKGLRKSLTEHWGVYLLMLVFGAIYAFWSVTRHQHFQTDAIDLGIFDQPMWYWSRFRTPLSTIKYNQFPGEHILGDHFHPILIPISYVFWLWNDVRALLIVQAIFVALAAYPIYKLAVKVLKEKTLGLAVAFAYLAFIGVQTAVDFDFHEIALATLPLAWALYFLAKGQDRKYLAAFLVGLLFKENMPLIFLMVGVVMALKFKKRRLGLVTIVVSAVYYWLVTEKFIPYFKHDNFAYEHLDPLLGRTTGDLIRTTLTQPWVTLKVLVTPILKFKTIVNYFASFGFLPLLAPISSLLVLPNFAGRFLTELPQRWLIRYQYSVILGPMLAFASIYGISVLQKLGGRLGMGWAVRCALPVVLILCPMIQTYRTNAPLMRILNPKSYRWEKRFDINYRLLDKIPPEASVMAQSSFVPHLTHRPEIYRYEDTLLDQTRPDYILMSLAEASDPPYIREQLEERIETLRRRTDYEVLHWDEVRLLMKRKPDGAN